MGTFDFLFFSKFKFCQKMPKNNKKERKENVVRKYFGFLPKNSF